MTPHILCERSPSCQSSFLTHPIFDERLGLATPEPGQLEICLNDGDKMHLPEKIKHKLAYLSGSHAQRPFVFQPKEPPVVFLYTVE